MALLNGGGQYTLDSDPVTAHDRRDFLPVFVEDACSHRLGILVAELENVADFDGGVDAQCSATPRAGFSGGHAAQVCIECGLEITIRDNVFHVVFLAVRPGDK